MGVSEKSGKSILSVPIKSSGSIGFGRISINGGTFDKAVREEIPLITLDSFFKEQKLSRIDFIKVDVEGHEMSVLKGARNLLETHSPAIMIEVNKNHLAAARTQPEDIFNFFQDMGYVNARIDEKNGRLIFESSTTIYDTDYLFYKE